MNDKCKSVLRDERRRRGWTQQQLGAIVGIQSSDISRIESGRMRPYPSQAERLARILGIRPEDLQAEAQ